MAEQEDITMSDEQDIKLSDCDQSSDSTSTSPDRANPRDELCVYPSNLNRPDLERHGLWTNKQYEEIDPSVQHTIEGIIEHITGGSGPELAMQGPENTQGEATSYTFALEIAEEAKAHRSNTVRRNLALVAGGIDTAAAWMDDGTFYDGGCKDPELDVGGCRDANLRIMEAILKEAAQLGTKEFESVMYYLEIVLGSMREALCCWRLDWGWDDRVKQFGHPHQGWVPMHDDYAQRLCEWRMNWESAKRGEYKTGE